MWILNVIAMHWMECLMTVVLGWLTWRFLLFVFLKVLYLGNVCMRWVLAFDIWHCYNCWCCWCCRCCRFMTTSLRFWLLLNGEKHFVNSFIVFCAFTGISICVSVCLLIVIDNKPLSKFAFMRFTYDNVI